MSGDRAQLDGTGHWGVVATLTFGVVAYLIWETTKTLPKAELQAAVDATPMWQWAPAVVLLTVIVAYIYPIPRVKRGNE